MTQPKKMLGILVVAILIAAPSVAIAGGGTYGFSFKADLSGFFHPVIKRVTVTSVRTGSPAAEAGLQKDDVIIKANGHPLEGASVHELQIFKKKRFPLQLKVKRGSEVVPIHVVSGAQTPNGSS